MELKQIVQDIIRNLVYLDYKDLFGDLAVYVDSIEKKGDVLFVYVLNPIVKYIVFREKDMLIKKLSEHFDVQDVRVVLKK